MSFIRKKNSGVDSQLVPRSLSIILTKSEFLEVNLELVVNRMKRKWRGVVAMFSAKDNQWIDYFISFEHREFSF